MIAKTIARKIIFPSITALGVEKLLSLTSKNKRMILMYHGVVPHPDFSIGAGHIDSAQFENHLKYLKKNFNVVSTSELFEMYRKNIIPSKPAIAITFDDGYENNYTFAFPLLKKYNLPATFFIATQCIEDENAVLWYDRLYFIKNKVKFPEIDFSNANVSESRKISVKKCRSNSEFVDFFKYLSTAEKEEFFKIIKMKINYEEIIKKSDRGLWKMMDKQQLYEVANTKGMELGSHSHSHPNLGEIQSDDAINELRKSKILLEQVTGKKVVSIAFPDGNYTEDVKKASRELGYTDLFAVKYQLESDYKDKNILPRFCISCTTTTESNIVQINAGFRKAGF